MSLKLVVAAFAGILSLAGCGGGGGGGGSTDSGGAQPTQTPIQAATALFNGLRTDLLSLHNTNGDGFLDKKLKDAQNDFNTNVGKTAFTNGPPFRLEAMEMSASLQINAPTIPATTAGLKLVNEYGGGSPTVPSTSYYSNSPTGYQFIADKSGNIYRVRASKVGPNYTLSYACFVDIGNYKTVTCFFGWIDSVATTTATGTIRNYRGFQVTETAVNGATRTYSWKSGTIQRSVNSTTNVYSDAFVGTPFTGAATATFVAAVSPPINLDISAGTLKGDIVPMTTNAAKTTLDITGQVTTANNVTTTNLSGTITNVDSSGAATLTMTIANGSQGVEQLAVGSQPGHEISVKLITQIKTAAFQYDGTLSAGSFAADKTGTNFTPGTITFNGTVSTLANGVATAFLDGVLAFNLTNQANYDSTKPTSPTNFEAASGSFEGKVTNAGTVYDLLFSMDATAYDPQKITLAYTKGTSKLVTVTATSYSYTPSAKNTLTASNADGSITVSVTQGPTGTTGTVNSGSTKIGDITGNKVVFTDGTFLTFI